MYFGSYVFIKKLWNSFSGSFSADLLERIEGYTHKISYMVYEAQTSIHNMEEIKSSSLFSETRFKKKKRRITLLKKTTISIFIIVFVLVPLAGCWDKTELNELAIVLAMGVDKNVQTGKINLTLQVIRPSALNSQQGGSREAPYDVITGSGNSIVSAINEAERKIDRRLFFSHLKVIIVGEKAARFGLSDLLDYVLRTHKVSQSTWLAVTQDEVNKVIKAKHGIESVQASYLEGIIKAQYEQLNVTSSTTYNFIRKVSTDGLNPVTGVITIQKQESISGQDNQSVVKQGLVLSGTAAFRKDKLKGYLNNKETRGLNYLIDASKGGSILVPSLESKNDYISIDITKVKCKITPTIINGKTTFNIYIQAQGNIAEVDDTTDVSNPKKLSLINRQFRASIQKDTHSAVIKSQKVLKTDILGFGRAYEKKYPTRWKKIKDGWIDYFPNEAFKVKVKTTIYDTGLQLKPIKKN
jgi:spore germination protein KC